MIVRELIKKLSRLNQNATVFRALFASESSDSLEPLEYVGESRDKNLVRIAPNESIS